MHCNRVVVRVFGVLEVEGQRFVVFVDLKVILAIKEVLIGKQDV